MDYFLSVKAHAKSLALKERKRLIRQTPTQYYVEIVGVIDYAIYKK